MPVNGDLIFFYFPRTCALAAHIALEESGLSYQRRVVDLTTEQNRAPDYLALNPTGAVPALSIGDTTLTETQAILTFIGDTVPEKQLLPPAGDFRRYRAHEWMNFLSSSFHVYIRSVFRSVVYAGEDTSVQAAVNKQGVANIAKAVATIEKRLAGKKWALGDRFSVADAYLFIMYLWSCDERIASIPDRPRWDALANRVWQRRAVKRVVEIENEHRTYGVPAHWR